MEKQQNKQGQNFENKEQNAQSQGGEDITKQDVLEGMGEGIQKGEEQEEE